jgi:hypothetical protein
MNPDDTIGTINWMYVFSTLLIRFVGVFIILGILQMGIYLSSKLISILLPPNINKSLNRT